MPPTILDRTVADSRPKAPQMGRSIEEQEFADEQAAGDVRMAVPRDGDAANEGMKNDPCLRRQGTRARKRIAGLWSKLRAIAYVASLQVGDCEGRRDERQQTHTRESRPAEAISRSLWSSFASTCRLLYDTKQRLCHIRWF